MNAGLIVIILLLVLSILGIPIYLALGIGTLVALNMADMPFIVLPQKLFAGMNSSSLLAIPFFVGIQNHWNRKLFQHFCYRLVLIQPQIGRAHV